MKSTRRKKKSHQLTALSKGDTWNCVAKICVMAEKMHFNTQDALAINKPARTETGTAAFKNANPNNHFPLEECSLFFFLDIFVLSSSSKLGRIY